MDRSQASAFLRVHMQQLYGYCLRRCASPQDAEDAAQDILMQAWRILQREDLRDPQRYLWTIARSVLVNHYRDRARCSVGVPVEAMDETDFQADLLAQDDIRRLHGELARLSRQQREIVVMHYFHRMKQADIASALQLPVGTVKWHLFEARKELKMQMEHPRSMEHLKFDPIRFSAFGVEGSIGPEGSPWRVFRSSLAQNIAYACRSHGRTITEIADALGVSPVYVEDEAIRMTEMHYLEEENGKYRSTILLTEWTEELIRLSDAMYLEAAAHIGPALADALAPALTADEDIVCPEGASPSYALWALIPWAIASQPAQGSISFRDVVSLRPDGAQNICHAAITPPGVPQPALAGRMERFSGPCWNENNGVTLWQIDTVWSEERISEMYQATEGPILALLHRMLVQGETLSKAEYAQLTRRGVIRAADSPEQHWQTQALWLRGKAVQERLLSLAADVFRRHKDTLSALRAPWASALMAATPPHLRQLREYLLDGVFRSDRFILHCLNHLVETGVLHLPTAEERGALHTVLITR